MGAQTRRDSKMTNELDEKLETASESGSQSTDPEKIIEERRLVRKLDQRILPITCLLYLFACQSSSLSFKKISWSFADLDRSNLGNARLQGLPQDILGGDKSGKLFDWINSVFFFSYVSGLWLLSFQYWGFHIRSYAKFPPP